MTPLQAVGLGAAVTALRPPLLLHGDVGQWL